MSTLVLERGQEWAADPQKAVFGSRLNYSEKMFWFRDYADWPMVLPFPMTPYAARRDGPPVRHCGRGGFRVQ
jgi:cholesterol oxidase